MVAVHVSNGISEREKKGKTQFAEHGSMHRYYLHNSFRLISRNNGFRKSEVYGEKNTSIARPNMK